MQQEFKNLPSNNEGIDPRTVRAKQEHEGKHFTTTDGKMEFIITKFNSAADIEIHFVGTYLTLHKSHHQIYHVGIPNPFASKKEGAVAAVYFEDPYKRWMGSEFITNQGYRIKIIDYKKSSEVTVQFQDEHMYTTTTTLQNIQNGQVFNPYHKNRYGAYIGEGPFSGNPNNDPNYNKIYNKWKNMLERVQEDSAYQRGHNTVSYSNCIVTPQWYNFNNYALWYTDQESKLNPNYTYEVDKDLKYFMYKTYTNYQKCYSPDTCVLMPHDLNASLGALIGRSTENNNAKAMAERYLADNAITKETYDLVLQCIEYYTT